MTTTVSPERTIAEAIEQLLTELKAHDDAAAAIRATLADLRRKLASSGKRAATPRRGPGKRRPRGLALDGALGDGRAVLDAVATSGGKATTEVRQQ